MNCRVIGMSQMSSSGLELTQFESSRVSRDAGAKNGENRSSKVQKRLSNSSSMANESVAEDEGSVSEVNGVMISVLSKS